MEQHEEKLKVESYIRIENFEFAWNQQRVLNKERCFL
jgi:hypothetical protein